MSTKIIVIYIVISVCFSISTNACTCGYLFKTDNLTDRITESGDIFIGSVIKVEVVKNKRKGKHTSDSLVKTDFLVSQIYKGEKISSVVSIYQEYNNCMLLFNVNHEYLIFTYKHTRRQYAYTNDCTPTYPTDQSNEYKIILNKVKEWYSENK